jgi:Pectate lyase superfamily protein
MHYSTERKSWIQARHGLALSTLFAAVLSGCGGGGGGGVDSAAGVDVATTANVRSDTAPSSVAPGPKADPAPTPVGVQLTSYGGVCDGRTDNNAAIARGLAEAKANNVALVIPEGQCNFSDVIRLDGAKIAGHGAASVLYATNWQAAAIFMSGASPAVSHVKLTGVAAPERKAAWEMTKITVFGGSNFVIDGVTIEGSPAAGIQTTDAPRGGRITNSVLRNTLADSIHLTDGVSDVLVENNLIENAGDDGIAVVSYQRDGSRVSDITVRNNVVLNNKWGRNLSTVGGSNITYENNIARGNQSGYACLYLAQENSYNTFSVQGVKATRNTLQNCGSGNTGHAAAMVFSDGAQPNDNILLSHNDIIQNGQDGIRYYGSQTNVRLEQNRITGAGTTYVGSGGGVAVVPYTGGEVGAVAP